MIRRVAAAVVVAAAAFGLAACDDGAPTCPAGQRAVQVSTVVWMPILVGKSTVLMPETIPEWECVK